MSERIVPTPPSTTCRLPLLIDSDVANEIDDLYAIALALASPDRFALQGIVATHFAQKSGPGTTGQSFQLLMDLLDAAGHADRVPARRGAEPMQFAGVPVHSDGADLIIESALAASEEAPLWVVVLGAATNTASAILRAPEIISRIRVVFHARCSQHWPERTVQFNIYGDIPAVQALLDMPVPLVWFDTGTKLTIPYEETEKRLAPLGDLGQFLHDFRNREAWFADAKKGFFDIGDIAWLIDATLCDQETVPAPILTRSLEFRHKDADKRGSMLRLTNIDVARTWSLFFKKLEGATATGIIR